MTMQSHERQTARSSVAAARTTSITLGLAALIGFHAPSPAGTIFTQGPCAGRPFCGTITGTGTQAPERVLRSFTFRAPGRGTALVSFSGMLVCTSSSSAGFQSAGVFAQIVDNNNI